MAPTVVFVPFARFDPDGAEHADAASGRLSRADNALPLFGGWYAWPTTAASSSIAGGPILGSYCHLWPSGVGGSAYSPDAITEFHGTEAALYTYDPATDTWTDRSRGGGYAAGALVPGGWRFASFGNDIWAVNGVDVPQRRTNNAGNFANGVTSTFVPVPRFMAPVRESMVVANLNQVGRFADEFACSDFDDATWFDPPNATRTDSLAISKTIRSRPGQITGLIGGEYGIFFKRRGMWGLQLTGGADIWRLDEISRSVGTPYPGSIVQASDGFNYFCGCDGFYRQAGLGAPEAIPGPRWLTRDSDQSPFSVHQSVPSTMWRDDLRVVGAESPATGIIFWFWRRKGGGAANDDGMKTTGITLDTRTLRWGGLLRPEAPEAFSTLASRPVNDQAAVALLWDLIGSTFDSGNAYRQTFGGTNSHSVTMTTLRFALSFGEDGTGGTGRITGILPVVATESNTSYAADYKLLPLPTGTTVNLYRSNDPNFVAQLDPLGAQVNPLIAAADTTQIDEYGFFPVAAEGRWFIVELVLPAGAGIRSIPGCYLRREILP